MTRIAPRLTIAEFLDTTVDYRYISARDVLREMIATIGVTGLIHAVNLVEIERASKSWKEQAELTAVEGKAQK